MKLLIEINNNKLAKKLLTIISLFQDEGVKVKEVLNEVEEERRKEENSALSAGGKGAYTEGYGSLMDEFRDREETKLKAKESTEFLRFLHKVYEGKENISKLSDEEALEDALRDKYGL